MAIPNIADFRASLRYGGARPSQFNVTVTNPAISSVSADASDWSFKCHAASLPSWNLTPIPVGYFGRRIKVPGNREFDNWQVNVILDEDMTIRDNLESWSNAINTLEGNVRNFATSEQTLYKSVAEVSQYSQTGNILRSYKINGIFPINVGEVSLDWDNDGQIETFPVTFSVDWFYIGNTTTGDAGGV